MKQSNNLVAEKSVTYANSAGVNTVNNVDLPGLTTFPYEGLVLITLYNPSLVTDLVLTPQVKETLNGTARYSSLTSLTFTKNTTLSFLVQGWACGDGWRASFSNSTILGGSDGFTAYFRIREV